jgi:UDP-N-acetylmuramate: L-alanyl-gamma-D-glutamyl-meso-diaminopimelate ligase
VRELFPNRKLTACLELHTFSSLNKKFLEEYHGTMNAADEKYVFYSPHTLEHKKLAPLNPDEVRKFFGDDGIIVLTDKNELLSKLHGTDWHNRNLLMMSSGNYDGLDWKELVNLLI